SNHIWEFDHWSFVNMAWPRGTTLVLALTAPAITFLQRQGSLQLRALPRQANFQTLKRPVFDGLDDLEEEEEVEDSTLGTVPKEQSMVPRPLGTGIQMLEELYGKHRGCKEPPEMNEEDLEDLHAMLKEELPRQGSGGSGSVSVISWPCISGVRRSHRSRGWPKCWKTWN
ncbi:unnamed protein product, partial [Durusdinium trenchii]